jgi:outer membrane receptor protein involved in Fe transport
MKHIFLIFGLLLSLNLHSQKITGHISDSLTSESLFGVTIFETGLKKGAVTEENGNYELLINSNKVRLEIRYIGYITKILEFNLKSDTTINIKLSSKTQDLDGVTVVHTIDRGSTAELIRIQSNSAVVVDGVNSDQFKKTPDSKVSDVFKRVSGASIQENKFVVIRGLSDRYNFGLINGAPLPSSEPDRKAFSFDIFPSNVLDNLVIYKTASPDLPGEFSGGVINLSTQSPKDKVNNLQIGLGFNTISTFRTFSTYNSTGLDYIGLGGISRKLPTNLPTTANWSLLNKDDKAELSKSMIFGWNTKTRLALPNGTLQWNWGKEWKLKKEQIFGTLFAVSYQMTESMNNSIRRDFEEQSTGVIKKMELKDSVFTQSVLVNAMANFNFRINSNHQIQFRNLYSINSEDKVNIRRGVREWDNDPRQWEKSTNFWYTQNNLFTSQLFGKHEFKKFKFNWNVSASDVRRDIPNLRRIVYRKYSYLEEDTTEQYVAVIQSNGTIPTAAGNMFWSKSLENIYATNYDFTIPVKIKSIESDIKFGGWHQLRIRDFSSRNFGFSQYKPIGSTFNSQLLLLGPDRIFSEENMGLLENGQGGFKLDEATGVDDSYQASSFLNAGFLMTDTKFGKKWRLVGGVRIESYNQRFSYIEFGSNLSKTIDTTIIDILPSANLIFSISEKMKLRAGYSRTVSRPEFRELAPFSFYNFVLDNITSGNPELQRATIDNFDVRWEFFRGSGQIVSVSGFYKNFTNPIELINRTGTSGAPELYYTNVDNSKSVGGELEVRSNLGFIHNNKFLDNLTLYTNTSLIYSEVNLHDFAGSGGIRPLQGQSPYIINCGLFWTTPKKDLSVNISYNMIGPRIFIVGNVQEPSVWEMGRNVIDLQITKTFLEEKIELKLNIKDILAQDLVYFQDLDSDRKLSPGDNRWQEINFGQTINLSFKYRFN